MKAYHKIFLSIIIFVSLQTAQARGLTISITKYGALGDGKTLNTKAIQKSIDFCSTSGGGKVVFPAGTWVSGTILLKDNVTLVIEPSATLLGSENIDDYYIVDGFKDGTGQDMGYCFIGAVDVKNVSIEGKGKIDGRGKAVLASGGKSRRPFLVRFVRCQAVKVTDVFLTASTAWTMHIFHCKDIKIKGLIIRSKGLANNDGIDIDCCENVDIRNCDIDTGDDAICFKTTSPFPCRNITIKNIRTRTNCAAIKMGTESAGNFENIKISNIRVSYAGLGAVKLLSVDGSRLSNINISDIEADSVNVPIMLRLGARLKTFRPEDKKQDVGILSNVKIKNVNVKNATTAGILISGIPDHLIDGITLENISINLNGGGSLTDAKIRFDEKIADYPEVRMFGRILPAYGMYLRHAENLVFKNVTFITRQPDARPALVAIDTKNLQLDNWSLPISVSNEPVISLTSARNTNIKSVKNPVLPLLFMNVDGKDSREIFVSSSSVNNSKSITLAKEISPDQLTIK